MSKTVEWSISLRQKKGIIKMSSILVNMIQDPNIGSIVHIGIQEYHLKEIISRLATFGNKTTYNEEDQLYLNEVRNLVLQYQRGELNDYLPF
jgi:altronate dehydratase